MTSEELSAYFRQEGSRLRGLACGRLGGNREVAEEAVQKLFAKLIRHYPSIDVGCLDRYVLAALTNVLRDIWRHTRQERKRVGALTDDISAVLTDPEYDLQPDEEEASIGECEALTREVISEMTRQQRAALRAWLFCTGNRDQAMQLFGMARS